MATALAVRHCRCFFYYVCFPPTLLTDWFISSSILHPPSLLPFVHPSICLSVPLSLAALPPFPACFLPGSQVEPLIDAYIGSHLERLKQQLRRAAEEAAESAGVGLTATSSHTLVEALRRVSGRWR